MSHHSDEAMLIAGSESFWEPGNYKRTTKRIEDGNKLCDDLMVLVRERAEIEKNYAKLLKTWASKWNNIIEKGPEYGTAEAAWKGVLVEADRLCDLHLKVKDSLHNNVIGQLKTWQKDNYHKSIIALKEKKEMDDQFKKAQKPWGKLLTKVNKAKADYHNACKAEKTAINQQRNASSDSSLSDDQKKKLDERVLKAGSHMKKSLENYKSTVEDIDNYNPKYIEDTTDVFERCQRMEAQRLQTFKDTLFALQKCLNITENPTLPEIYDEFYHTVNNADHEKDLRWWSNTYGVNMAMNWPTFEEYTEEFREIASKSKKLANSGIMHDGHITLINQRTVGDDLPDYSNNSKSSVATTAATRNGNAKTSSSGKEPPQKEEYGHAEPTTGNGNVTKESNPFDDEEWDEYNTDPLVDNGEKGIPVKALYDYEAAENDELDFRAGDCFEKLEDEDEQGWCKGRKDGKVGLYPANYIEVL